MAFKFNSVLVYLSAIVCLSGTVNVGFTGPWMALPWAITIAVLVFKNVANAKAVGAFVVVFGGALLAAQSLFPAMYFYGIGGEVVLDKPTRIDESGMLACDREEAKIDNVHHDYYIPAGAYKIVSAITYGGIDAPVRTEYLVKTPQGDFSVSTPSKDFNYSCVVSSPVFKPRDKSDRNVVRSWSEIASIGMYWPIVPAYLVNVPQVVLFRIKQLNPFGDSA